MLETVLQDPLVDQIEAIQVGQSDDYWSFKKVARRTGAHALIHYPAMMVPTLQGKLLDAIKLAKPETKSVLDPFAGSGTILVESMSRQLSFTGLDINPLATLACLAKSGPYYVAAFDAKRRELVSRITADKGRQLFVTFDGQKKWFDDEASIGLSRIARCICREDSLWARRLFWLAFAKVVRSSCNSRMSTYKLHARKMDSTAVRTRPEVSYASALDSFSLHLREQNKAWTVAGSLRKGIYTEDVEIQLGDSRKLLEAKRFKEKFDVVMTSPPYGDNSTTIPYGQYAYLPLKWMPPEDVSVLLDTKLLANTHSIDTASLGGSRKNAAERGAALAGKYDAAKRYSQGLSTTSSEYKRFAVFFADLEDCLDKICTVTKQSGYQAWTIGNRHLGGKRVPMEDILQEMLEERGVLTVGRIRRSIHAKKMATRNSVSDTMSTETVVLARKRVNEAQPAS